MAQDNITLTKQELAEILEKAVEKGTNKSIDKASEKVGSFIGGIGLVYIFLIIGAFTIAFSTTDFFKLVGVGFLGLSFISIFFAV